MNLRFIRTDCTDPFRNLATEEYMTMSAEPNSILLFLWQNDRTVVLGRHQDPWAECPVGLLAEEGVTLARRSSGGGAVYHDLGNLNYTFIVREELFDVDRQNVVILQAIRSLGIPAELTGRNDMEVRGRKFSGHATFMTRGRCCHHGTLLVHSDLDALTRYLQPSQEKLRAHGVRSVRSRVENLKTYRPGLTIQEVVDSLLTSYAEVYGGTPVETVLPAALPQHLLKRYSSEEWRFGSHR